MGGGVLVIAFEFGNLCFNSPASEQSIIMVIASPSEFSSLDKFITAALTFLETDGKIRSETHGFNQTDLYSF